LPDWTALSKVSYLPRLRIRAVGHFLSFVGVNNAAAWLDAN
jgi:hypothetical protein